MQKFVWYKFNYKTKIQNNVQNKALFAHKILSGHRLPLEKYIMNQQKWVDMGMKTEELCNLYHASLWPGGWEKIGNKIIGVRKKEREKERKNNSLCTENLLWVKCLLCERQPAFIDHYSLCFLQDFRVGKHFPRVGAKRSIFQNLDPCWLIIACEEAILSFYSFITYSLYSHFKNHYNVEN